MCALVAVGAGILNLELLRNGSHLGLRGLERDAILEPTDGEEIMAAAALLAGAELVNGSPELSAAARRKQEVFREDADDGGGSSA